MKNIETVEYAQVESIGNGWDYEQVILDVTDSVIYQLNEAIDCEQVNDKDELIELLNDSVLHEIVDGSEYIIYTAYHLPIIQHSDNDEYMLDNFGMESLAASLEKGLSNLHMAIAFWALYADVQERINDILDEYDDE
jgi:hypothetical protein